MNKWFNKQTITVFILALLISSTGFVVAETALKITQNPFPILVNGKEVKTEGYNINGSTYLKTRDISTVVGLPIEFKDKKIYIGNTTEESTKTTSDGIKTILYEGKNLVSISDIIDQTKKYNKELNYIGNIDKETKKNYLTYFIINKDKQILYKFQDYISVNKINYIDINFYENEILPILKK